MRRPTPSTSPGFDSVLVPYALVGIFTLLFWAITLILWRQIPALFASPSPNIFLTLLSLPLPYLGYWAITQPNPSAPEVQRRFNPLTYIGVEIFALMFWTMAVWLWLQAYVWSTAVSEFTFILVFLFLLLPYLALVRSGVGSLRSSFGLGGQPASNPTATGTTAGTAPIRQGGIIDWIAGWLTWLGSGESHRGTLVLLVIIFWSMFFWSLPTIQFSVLSFAGWGLITIFLLVLIRSLFFRQTTLPAPGQEVPAAKAESKSQPK